MLPSLEQCEMLLPLSVVKSKNRVLCLDMYVSATLFLHASLINTFYNIFYSDIKLTKLQTLSVL
jgi:hypothetical protein